MTLDIPEPLTRVKLPQAVNDRLQELLDRQDTGLPLTVAEREEAEGLVALSEFLTLVRLRRERGES